MFINVRSFFGFKEPEPEIPVEPVYSAVDADVAELMQLTHQALKTLSPAEIKAADYILAMVPGSPFVSPYNYLLGLYEPGSKEWQEFYATVKRTVRCFHVDETATVVVWLELRTEPDAEPEQLGVF